MSRSNTKSRENQSPKSNSASPTKRVLNEFTEKAERVIEESSRDVEGASKRDKKLDMMKIKSIEETIKQVSKEEEKLLKAKRLEEDEEEVISKEE